MGKASIRRLFDPGLLTRDLVAQLCIFLLLGLPIGVGAMLARMLAVMPHPMLTRAPWTLFCSALNFSLALVLLRHPENVHCRRLSQFFLLLGSWNLVDLFALASFHPALVYVFRAGYAASCVVLLRWFEFWRGYLFEENASYRPVERVLRWTASAMSLLSLCTPWVLASLRFDAQGRTGIVEIAGPAYPLFALWFVVTLAVTGGLLIHGVRRLRTDVRAILFRWTVLCNGLGTAAAGAYFWFVWGRWHIPVHHGFQVFLCFALVGALGKRLTLWGDLREQKLVEWRSLALPIPFVCGLLLSGPVFCRVVGLLLAVGLGPEILRQIRSSVEAWVDQNVFGERYSYLADLKKMSEGPRDVGSLQTFLPTLAGEIVRKAHVQSCTIVILLEELASRPRFTTTIERRPDGRIQPGIPWSEQEALVLLHVLKQRNEFILRQDVESDEPMTAYLKPEAFQAALPLQNKGRTYGMIVLGHRRGKVAGFNQRDRMLFESLSNALSSSLWSRIEQYEQIMRLETALHDALNYLKLVELNWAMRGLETKDLGAYNQGINLLRDLRAFNQLSLEQQLGRPAPVVDVDLGERILHLSEIHRAALDSKGLALHIHIDTPLPTIRADEKFVDRCLANLLNNAIKFTEKGVIEISLMRQSNALELSVQDTGRGISEEALARVFEPFYRVSGKKDFEEGSGLGLAIVKEYMTSIGGHVSAASQPGEGTRFSILFPIDTHKERSAA